MDVLKLKANPTHPTFRKVQRLIAFLEHLKLDMEWVDGAIKIRDQEFCVAYDFVTEDGDRPQTDMPPTFEYKLIRDKFPNKYCKCRHCNPNFDLVDKDFIP